MTRLWRRFTEWLWQFEPQRAKLIHEAERVKHLGR